MCSFSLPNPVAQKAVNSFSKVPSNFAVVQSFLDYCLSAGKIYVYPPPGPKTRWGFRKNTVGVLKKHGGGSKKTRWGFQKNTVGGAKKHGGGFKMRWGKLPKSVEEN